MGTEQQGKGFQPMRKAAVTMNGITVAYMMGVVNALLATLLSFGVDLNTVQQASIATLVNASLVLAVHLAHRLGETVALGADTAHSQSHTAALTDNVRADQRPAFQQRHDDIYPGEAAHGN